MPSSPKKTQKTGSVLLGQELRRLRGGRTLREIAQLTKSAPLANHVATVSEANLCEIESGKTMPSLPTMHALSVIYKTSMSQLMAYVQQERSAASVEVDTAAVDLEREFSERLRRHHWPEALAITLIGERTASEARGKVAWRANRAACLAQMGQIEEAIAILTWCSESDVLGDQQRISVLFNLGATHHNAGHLRTAALVMREALEIAGRCEVEPTMRAAMELSRAQMLIDSEIRRTGHVEERRLREALRLLDSASAAWPPDDRGGRNWIAIAKARAQLCLGNALLAERDIEQVILSAKAPLDNTVLAGASLALATVRERQGRRDECAPLLQQALDAASAASETDRAFEASFRLFLLHRGTRPGLATGFLRHCGALFPLISANTHWRQEYEAFQRSAT